MKYRIRKVERLPALLDNGVVYVSDEFEVAALLCPCGCGHRISLLLGDGHIVKELHGLADIQPSIGVWDAKCRSHFWLRGGVVMWASRFSEGQIRGAMEHQVRRHSVAAQPSHSWPQRLIGWLKRTIGRR